VVPALFVAFAGALLVATVLADPRDTLIGLALLLTGVPLYLYFKRRS
jgi:APA family basic amino acid/polyamine antiporter